MTKAHLGKHKLFSHDFKFVEVSASYGGMGVSKGDFKIASSYLKEAIPDDMFCDEDKCLLKE